VRDLTLVPWRALAKDGMDLPRDQATMRPRPSNSGMETYDFELTPAGDIRLTITSERALLQSMVIHTAKANWVRLLR
jgi:hypothetical protein